MNANVKEFLLYFAKLSECDTSSCRLGFNAALDEKQYEDARQSKKHIVRQLSSFVSISVVRGQQNFPEAV